MFKPIMKIVLFSDSGAPIQIFMPDYKCVAHIIGVTSYGSAACGMEHSPAIYVRVSAYLDWIEQKVWGRHY
jgi:secreted trypsin-like serine protease